MQYNLVADFRRKCTVSQTGLDTLFNIDEPKKEC